MWISPIKTTREQRNNNESMPKSQVYKGCAGVDNLCMALGVIHKNACGFRVCE